MINDNIFNIFSSSTFSLGYFTNPAFWLNFKKIALKTGSRKYPTPAPPPPPSRPRPPHSSPWPPVEPQQGWGLGRGPGGGRLMFNVFCFSGLKVERKD